MVDLFGGLNTQWMRSGTSNYSGSKNYLLVVHLFGVEKDAGHKTLFEKSCLLIIF